MNIEYEETTLSDLTKSQLNKLKKLTLENGSLKTMIDEFAKKLIDDNDIIIAYHDSIIVGWACVYDVWHCDDFAQVFVISPYRKRGIGKTLIEMLLKNNPKMKASPSDEAGLKLYKKFGNIEIVDNNELMGEKWTQLSNQNGLKH